jgi:release factor glutamine methyltransferase
MTTEDESESESESEPESESESEPESESGDGTDTRDALAERRGLGDPVYQPAEDSGLLADAGRTHAHGVTVEIGTGSGWVAGELRAVESVERVIGTDLNPHACREAENRGVESLQADLVSPFRANSLDTVLFNPPYLPTDPDNEWDDWKEHALSGGENGRAVIEPFLDSVARVLTESGVVLLLVSSLTGFADVVEYAVESGFAAETVVEESYPYETLSVLKLTVG